MRTPPRRQALETGESDRLKAAAEIQAAISTGNKDAYAELFVETDPSPVLAAGFVR